MAAERIRVLIAEDNRVMADVIRFNLQRAGYDVYVAPDGRDAARAAAEQSYDFVMTDYQMPGMTGEEFCRSLRSLPGYADVPILMCSAKGYELDTMRLKEELGITRVLFKPFSPKEIVAIIQEALEGATASA